MSAFRTLWAVALALMTALTPFAGLGAVVAQEGGDEPLAPQVIDVWPFPGEEMALDQPLTITFDQPMDQPGVEAAVAFTPGVPGAFSWDDARTLVFTPTDGWARDAVYEVVIGMNAQSAEGVGLAEPYKFKARTVGYLEVSTVVPDVNAQGVAANAVITVAFSRPVVPLVSTEQLAGLPHPLTLTPAVEGTGEWLNTSIYQFAPKEVWQGGTTYTVTVNKGLTDVSGAVLAEDFTWQFTTLPPEILAVSPSNGATDVPIDSGVRVVFSQPMDRASVEAAFALMVWGRAVEGTFTWYDDGAGFTFQPLAQLDMEAVYSINLGGDAKAASGEASLREGITYTFTSMRWPGIDYTSPSNGERDVYPGSGVGIYFKTPMNTETFKDKVVIDPPTTWTPRVSGSQALYLEFAALPNTTYTVIFQAGAEDIYGNRIETDYSFSFRTGEIKLEPYASLIRQGNFMITGGYRENTRVALAVQGAPNVKFMLYRIPLEAFQSAAEGYYYHNETAPWEQPQELIREWWQQFDSGMQQYTVAEVLLASEGGGVLPSGVYGLVMQVEGDQWDYPERMTFAVADANVTFKRTEDEVFVWVTDMPTAAPLTGAKVTLYQSGGAALAAGQTDADGVFRTPANVGRDTFLYAVAESETSYGIWYSTWTSSQPYSAGYLYTDRPIYRPDQKVYFRGVLRARDDMDYRVPDVATVHVIAEVNWGEQTLYEADLDLTDFGTFSGEFDIPAESQLGTGRIYAYTGSYSAEVYFEIAEFRTPEFKVEVTAAQDNIVQGQTLNAVGAASYYFGGAVSNAQVYWNAYGERAYFNYTGPGRYTFTDIGGEDWYYYGWWQVAEGQGVTDANGQIVISSDNTKPEWQGPMNITVEATVTDESGQAISGRTTVMAHPANLYVGVGSDKYFGKAGEPFDLRLIAVTPESVPVPDKRINVTLIEVRWTRVAREDQYGRYDWEMEEIEVETGHAVTGADGVASYRFTPPNAGIFRVRIDSFDEKERTTSAGMRFWVTGDRPVWWGRPSDTIEPIADKELYNVGDTAEILIPIPFAGQTTVLVSLERAGVIEYEVIEHEGSTLLYNLPITEDFAPTVHVSVTMVKGQDEESLNPEYKQGSIALSVVPSQSELTVSVTPSKTTAQPRDTVSFDIETRDSTGEPVGAEVGVTLTDLAILSLVPPNSAPLLDYFYGWQSNYVYTGVSMSVLLDRLTDEYIPTEKERRDTGTATPAATATAALAPAPGAAMFALEGEVAEEAAMDAMGGGGGGAEPPVVREEFAQTPLWAAHVVTDRSGHATVSVDLPDNLTTWQLDARALTEDTKVGQTTTDLMVTLPLLVRPVAPRFFVVGDRVELAAVINNNTDQPQTVQATLEAAGVVMEDAATQSVEIAPLSRGRVTWTVVAQDVPFIDLTYTAIGADGYSDAAKPMLATGPDGTIPVYHYTAPDTTGTGGMIVADEGGSVTEGVSLPPRLDTSQGELVIKLDPSLAVTATDAFDYLKQYPHYCIEQTVSRFLPNVVTYRALRDLGIEDPALEANLKESLNAAIDKLRQEQKTDGGWGWFASMESNPLVTAYAALGLIEARDAGFDFDAGLIDRALAFVRQDDFIRPNIDTQPWRLNRQAFYFYVFARDGQALQGEMDGLLQYRLEMSFEARAFLLMAYHALGDVPVQDQKQALISDLNTGAVVSATGSHWEEGRRDWWNWTSDTRATAIALAALVRTDPGNALLPGAVRWLMVARQGDHWTTTQETVWSVIGLTNWMVYTGELRGDYAYRVSLNRAPLEDGEVTPDTVREGRELRVAVADLLRDEVNRLTLAKGEGPGVLYYTAHLKTRLWASEAKPISRGIQVTRQYFIEGDPDTPVSAAKVGDVINVRLTITADEDIYYFVLEDPIPAGTEGVDTSLLTTSTLSQDPTLVPQRDRYWWWWGWWWFKHTEMRDEQVNLYADFLPRGTYTYTYQVRASIAGEFQTMPSHAYAFYFPEVFGRGEGTLFTVSESAGVDAGE
ncbi:MAG: Ig-like domain-containing protein [Anaerolineae bacterium]|nr:Ig-like domain-containing protein [Anaerolineae bacterium]